MKLQNIFALIVTLIGFAACTSESELPDTLVNGDLVPVTISLGSMQTKASVGLDGDEGAIQNAVIAIFDSKGIPTIAPIVLKGQNSGTTRLPLVKSNAYAFVNVSDEDIAALEACGSEDAFKGYTIKKELTQKASDLPKFGKKVNFTPTDGGTFEIPVNQLTARLDVRVSVELTENGASVAADFQQESLTWANIETKSSFSSTIGNKGPFSTTINGITYDNVINRAYSYPGAKPSLALTGTVNGEQKTLSFTFNEALEKDNVYLLNVKIKGELSKPATVSFEYQLVDMGTEKVDVPTFN